MEPTPKPNLEIAVRVLPAPLLRALQYIFAQNGDGCMLVGGTALAGFYAGHRRSDDLDLFTRDADSQRATILAVKSLTSLGAKFIDPGFESQQYFKALVELDQHRFTVDVVLDADIFRMGESGLLPGGIRVATLPTLVRTKAATLVSRCSEKDLYDLLWLFEHLPDLTFAQLVELGQSIDGGLNPESLLIALGGATLSKNACHFGLTHQAENAALIFEQISRFRKELIRAAQSYLENLPTPPLRELVTRIAQLRK